MSSANDKLQVAVVGATGYAGQELVRILARHPSLELVAITSHSYVGKKFTDVYPQFRGQTELVCEDTSVAELADRADLVFIALPHGEAASMVDAAVLRKCKVVDLGADFRLQDASEYEDWYHLAHPNPGLLPEATYGLCELNREKIKAARLLANPGCYATASILAMAPLLAGDLINPASIIIDAKSGVSGAGRAATLGVHFNEVNESIKAYGLASHRHTPEIEQELSSAASKSIKLNFTPHLVPMNRGILVTAYAALQGSPSADDLAGAFASTYAGSKFVRVSDHKAEPLLLPETRWVKGSNYCDIGFKIDPRTNRVIVVAALDNLIKGAAGQAVQNLNLMSGFDEAAGLSALPVFPA